MDRSPIDRQNYGASWKRLLVIVLFVPVSFMVDIVGDCQHRLLATGPYLPHHVVADAAVVLGYALKRDGSPTLPLRQRVDAGAHLFEEERVQTLAFSGGHPGGGIRGRSEAAAMLEYALKVSQRESKPAHWLLEEQSTSTRENAVFSLQIGVVERWKSVVVATNPFHQLRSRLVFQCAAKEAFPGGKVPQIWLAHVQDKRSQGGRLLIDPWIKQWNFWRELAALLYYQYMGWLC